jgi:hypothetical protein
MVALGNPRLMAAVGVVSALVVCVARVAHAQAGPGRSLTGPSTGWIVEAHVGTMPDRMPDKVVTHQLPAQGPTFPSGQGASVDTSRRVPSWYFGDGAAILNGLADRRPLTIPHIVSLDPVLTSAATTTTTGANLGVRIGHTVTKRVLVLFSYDQASAQLPLTDAVQTNATASNDSFQTFWNTFLTLRRPTTLTNVSAKSTLSVDQASGSERMLAVTADVRVITLGGWTPFVTVGGGLALPLPQVQTEVTLVGNYQATVVTGNNRAALNETDQLRIRYEMLPAPFQILGVGVERGLSAHVGVRADFRSFLGVNQVRTRIDTAPISGPTPPPTGVIRAGGTPDVQISTNPSFPTTLSLQGIDHFDSFEARGNLSTFSAGVFLRF